VRVELVHHSRSCTICGADDGRRREAEAHVAFGEGAAILPDALLAEAFGSPDVRRTQLVASWSATLGMIGGQYRDITGDDDDLEQLQRLKTGSLFVAAVRIGLEVANVPESARAPWLGFGDAVGLLFQLVDDFLDGDGYAERLGGEATERLAAAAGARAHAHLDEVGADTSVLRELVDVLVLRTG
jgi:geranylgeranyl pyrophosphate synthase